MAEYLMDTTDLTKIASAIRTKGGTSDSLVYPDGFVTAIQAIQAGTELQIIVSVASGAAVTATKGSNIVSGTSVNGVCTLIVPEAGTWSVKATHNGQTSDTKSITFTDRYELSLSFASAVLNDNDWATIKEVSDNGEGANYWSIGDCKEVTLNGTVGELTLSNFKIYAFIIGFNHNSSLEGANRIHFQLAKTALSSGTDVALCDSNYNKAVTGFCMNTSSSSSGGWASSNMRTAFCGTSLSSYSGTIIAVIPAELRAVLKSVTKYTNNTGNSTAANAVTATTDYFFLLSEYEVFGSTTKANKNEASKQAQYSYYSAGNSKVKYNHSETSTSVMWWLRSPYPMGNGYFIYVSANGKVSERYAHYSCGFAPGFCV